MQIVPEITVQEFALMRQNNNDFFLLDVRNLDEYTLCNLKGHLIPFNELANRLHELNPNQHIIVHCHSGGRSRRAVEFLLAQGFSQASNLRGGITAWANEIDPTMPTY